MLHSIPATQPFRRGWARARHWITVTRHVRALSRSGYHVSTVPDHRFLLAMVDRFSRWAQSSGSLNDGRLPSPTKKKVRAFSAMLEQCARDATRDVTVRP